MTIFVPMDSNGRKYSCSFDCVMNIFIQFYFEVGRVPAKNDSYLETLGCLGLIFRDNCNNESDFNPYDIRDKLFALFHEIKVSNIHHHHACTELYIFA